MTVTEKILALRDEAGTAGDFDMVFVCERALDGDDLAIDECLDVMNNARAQED